MKVYYHDKCHDGYSCVLLMKKVFPSAEYIGYRYQDTVPSIDSEEIWFVDVALTQNQLDMLVERLIYRSKVVIIDHHPATGRLTCSDPRVKIIYHPEKSGGRLVWEYLFTEYKLDVSFCSLRKCPDFVSYTEDHDLWRFALPMSLEVRYALQSLDYTKWEKYGVKDWMTMGVPLRRMVDKQVDAICANAYFAEVSGHKVYCVNATSHHSEVGHRLSEGMPFAAVWNYTNGKYKYSLRSHELDVSKIAESFGGGGHKLAAGFMTDSRIETNVSD